MGKKILFLCIPAVLALGFYTPATENRSSTVNARDESVYLPHPLLAKEFLALVQESGLSIQKQSACVEDETGIRLSVNATMPIVPASVTKLYVFDFALSVLPKNFRYQTELYRVGDTLYINGGGDSHFLGQHLRDGIDSLYAASSDRSPLAHVIIAPQFYLNWFMEQDDVRKEVYRVLAEKLDATRASTIDVVFADAPYRGTGERVLFRSMPLVGLLKQIGDYSNNTGAEALFRYLGGAPSMMAYLKNTYGSDAIAGTYFTRGSGLYGNYTTCALTIRVLKHLRETTLKKDIELTDVLPMPLIDPGVLATRDIARADAQMVLAKSGYINRHHTLAGIINTTQGPVYFGIFATYDASAQGNRVKQMIDTFVQRLIETYRPVLKSYEYVPNDSLGTDTQMQRL